MFWAYFNDVAYDLIKWAVQDFKNKNRNKYIRIQRKADELEIKYRKRNNISLDGQIWCYKPYINEYKFGKLYPKK